MATAKSVFEGVQRTKVLASTTASTVLERRRQLEIDEANHAHALEQATIAEMIAVKTFTDAPLYLPDTNTLVYVKDGELKSLTPSLPDSEVQEVKVDVNGDGEPDELDPPAAACG